MCYGDKEISSCLLLEKEDEVELAFNTKAMDFANITEDNKFLVISDGLNG